MVSKALAKAVAEGLAVHPEWIQVAKDNLRRWRLGNSGSPSLLRCYEEWERVLERPTPEVVAEMLSETPVGERLRRNSPFAGVLPPGVVESIKRRCRDEASAA